MARQTAPNMVRMESPDRRAGLRLRGGGNPCHAHRPVTKISARVRRNRAWAVAGRAPNQSAVKPEPGIHPHQGRAERMTSEPAPEKPTAPLPPFSACLGLLQRPSGIASRRPACAAAVLLITVLVPLVTGAAPLPPPRPRNQSSAPSPPPAPVQPAPTQQPPVASPTDQECLADLQKLGFNAEAVGPPPASEPACVIDQPVRLRSLRLSAEPMRDITFPDGPVVACRFAERFGHWVGDLAAVLVRGQLGTELKAVPTGVGFECRKRNRAATGKLSAHALGLAVDVAGFELASGGRLFVTESQDSPKVALLSALRRASCGWFTTILGPGTDAMHADHWHLDIEQHGSSASYRICQ